MCSSGSRHTQNLRHVPTKADLPNIITLYTVKLSMIRSYCYISCSALASPRCQSMRWHSSSTEPRYGKVAKTRLRKQSYKLKFDSMTCPAEVQTHNPRLGVAHFDVVCLHILPAGKQGKQLAGVAGCICGSNYERCCLVPGIRPCRPPIDWQIISLTTNFGY